jgi:CcmD family protein
MMKLFKRLLPALFVMTGSSVFAQASGSDANVQMADGFYAEGKIFVVIGVVSIVFIGIAVYLFMIERKIKKLEQIVKEKNA